MAIRKLKPAKETQVTLTLEEVRQVAQYFSDRRVTIMDVVNLLKVMTSKLH